MNLASRIAAFVLMLLGSVIAMGQVPDQSNLRGDSAQTRKRLAEAEQKLLAGKTAEATDDLQRVLDEASDDLITTDGKQYRAARWVAHGILAKLPPDALRSYQDRIDDPARKLLDAGKRNRDPAPLWQLLDRYFVSRPADEALLLLGDLLHEDGEFRRAERIWRQLIPDADGDIVYPKSRIDPAIVRARLILAAIFQGDTDRAKTELAAFKKMHSGANGQIAGKDGPLANTLQSILDKPPQLPLPANSGTNWPTYGGGPDRSGRVARFPRDLPSQPTWKPTIAAATAPRHHELPMGPPNRPPFGNPVIVNGSVFVSDGWEVYGFDLISGRKIADLSLLQRPDSLVKAPDPSPTLTAAGDRLYARAGPGAVKSGDPTAIVCMAMTARADGTPLLKELWRVKPPVTEGKLPVVWEGAPLVDGRRMWAAYARFEGGRVIHGIACYDPADTLSVPERPAWSADVCESQLPVFKDAGTAEGRSRHELITLAGRNVVFCSNAGSVIALDAASGRRAWGYRYPRGRKADANRSSVPAPAVASSGRVFVAPTDADRIYALDSETGQLLWPPVATEGAHILGVSAGRLIVAVSGPVRGIRGLSVANGSYRAPEGWHPHNGGGFLGYGHGFVSDDAIVWPTQGGLYILDADDGLPAGSERPRYSGNATYADGVLVVVTPTQVLGYVSETKRFGPPNPRSDREKFERQVGAAENALAVGKTATARVLLVEVARSDLPKPYRAWAAARLLLLTPKTEVEPKLPADLNTALAAELLDEWLIPPDGVPATLRTLLDRHLGRESASTVHDSPPLVPHVRGRKAVPSLSPEAEIVESTKFEKGTAPLLGIPGMVTPPKRLFVSTASQILAISLTDRAISRHSTTDRFNFAAEIKDGFVTAGPLSVAVFGTNSSPLWVFRVPTTDPLPRRPGEFRLISNTSTTTAELSSFRLIGSWLFARLGERHLIALDLHGKRVAWVLGACGKPGFGTFAFQDAVQFGPHFMVTGQLLVVQLSDGQRWFVQVQTGRRLELPGLGGHTTKVWWPQAPVDVHADHLPMADGPGLVRMLNVTTGKVKWKHQEGGEPSLTGEPLQVQVWGEDLMIAVRRNHGVELNRLDLDDGKPVWQSGVAFLDTDRMNLSNADADADRVYTPVGNMLYAFMLKDGKGAWEVELPDACNDSGWVVRAGQKCVIVHPESAIPREHVADVFDRLLRSFRAEPILWRLPGLAFWLYDAWVSRTVPVLLLDPETGEQLGRFEIPAAGPAIVTWFDRDLAVIATGNRVVWLR